MVSDNAASYSLPIPATEDTPLLGGNIPTQPRSSQLKTFANVFIAIVGAGVLGLPYCFKRTGWLLGLLMMFSVAALTFHCMMLLIHTRRKLESLTGYSKIASFGDLGFAVCGPVGRAVVDVMILLSQAGFCVGYLIFIANTLANLYSDESILGISAKALYIWGCLPFQLGLNSVKTLTHLAPVSIFADVIDIGAMGVVMVEDLGIIMNNMSQVRVFGGLSVFFYGMGVAVFSFEGMGVVLHLEDEANDKHNFSQVLAISMAFAAILYGGFGTLGYFAFGEGVMDIITANMGKGFLSSLVQLGLCVNLFFTFPLMMHPVYEILERRFRNGSYCIWSRWLLVLFVTLVSLLVPNFTDFLSLVGSSICCGLGFVLPTLFHLKVFKEEMDWRGWSLDVGIMTMGVILGITGTWYSLIEIIT